MQSRTLFSYRSYKAFIRDWVKQQPKGGRGQFRQLAARLRTNSVTISQIFSGDRELSSEQALELCEHLGLSDLESRFFISLVLWERAGTTSLKRFYEKQLEQIRSKSKEIKSLIKPEQELTQEAKAIFYSDWIYSAVRVFVSINKVTDANSIAEALNVPRSHIVSVLQFLKDQQLIFMSQGVIEVGARSTHLDAKSPLSKSRHASWRLKAAEFMDTHTRPENLFFTAPCSISKKDYEEFKDEIRGLIAKFTKRVKGSQPEALACFNIDYFRIYPR